MQAKLYNQLAEEVGIIELAESVFALPVNADLVQQVRVAMQANQRQPVAHTKFRGEVRGGGRKPWRQKGTGRARHGSRRSPIWKGGGVTHGPRKEKSYTQKINSKVARLALRMALSSKLASGQIKVIDDLNVTSGKTKDFLSAIKPWKNRESALFVGGAGNKNVELAARNLENGRKIKVVTARQLNLLDVLKFKKIILTSEAIKYLSANP
ncbi:MAG: 50S ribosomal protein L4 [Parcubacteria group bacterium]|nr:50S ribosomal protein L4 [Parcubacteria group bacterium]